jgi:hypothetical protein
MGQETVVNKQKFVKLLGKMLSMPPIQNSEIVGKKRKKKKWLRVLERGIINRFVVNGESPFNILLDVAENHLRLFYGGLRMIRCHLDIKKFQRTLASVTFDPPQGTPAGRKTHCDNRD